MNNTLELNFKPLFKIAYYSIIAMLIFIPLQVIVYIASPPPETVLGFFELYQESTLLGLLSLDLLYSINYLFLVPIYIAISIILFREKPSYILLAMTFGIISLALYYPANPAVEMYTLSNQYFNALPENSSLFLSAGEALMAGYTGTSSIAYYIIANFALILFSLSLYQSKIFKKSIGFWGLVSGFFMLIPPSIGIIGMIFSLISLIPWCIFIILLMKEFKKLSNQI